MSKSQKGIFLDFWVGFKCFWIFLDEKYEITYCFWKFLDKKYEITYCFWKFLYEKYEN